MGMPDANKNDLDGRYKEHPRTNQHLTESRAPCLGKWPVARPQLRCLAGFERLAAGSFPISCEMFAPRVSSGFCFFVLILLDSSPADFFNNFNTCDWLESKPTALPLVWISDMLKKTWENMRCKRTNSRRLVR